MGKYKAQTLMPKKVLHKMEVCDDIQISKRVLQLVFLELLYKDNLINKGTYYTSQSMLKIERAMKCCICV